MEFVTRPNLRFSAIATDYDGTLAEDGAVSPATYDAMLRFKASGRALLLVTGRELPDLRRVFPNLDIFDSVVAENGALLFDPTTGDERPLGPPPSGVLLARLRARGVGPISVGRCIIATWEPHEVAVLECIKELKLELNITFNKGAVMILPTGINKATGLAAALERMGIAHQTVIGIGDAENDHAFLRACGFSVAVANALDAVKETADMVTSGSRGQGVVQLVDHILAGDDAGKSQKTSPRQPGVAEGIAS